MSKALRQHAPGCVFHITARTQGKHPWFTDLLKPRVEDEIFAAATMAGMGVLAHVIMHNHFHIVLRQGSQPLAYMMHRVMHRTAAMLKRAHGMDGHVFGRRYWSGLIESPAYVRRAIVYTHLNPCRASLCRLPQHYEWSSHRAYVQACGDSRHRIEREEGLRFFANSTMDDPLKHYLEHVEFQMNIDAYMRGELRADSLIPPPSSAYGNSHWDENYQAALQLAQWIKPKQPIYDVAYRLLERLDPLCSLDLLRSGVRGVKLVRIRRDLSAALLTAGFRETQIARLLGISTSSVSKVAVSLRT